VKRAGQFITVPRRIHSGVAPRIGVFTPRIAVVIGRRKCLVAGDAILAYGIARFIAGKRGATTAKTRLTNRKNAII
jgi:hypothetical protein